MAQCPVCQSEIEITNQHHGTLFTCPRCNAVFFVDWNGQPEAASPLSDEAPVEIPPYEQGPVPHEEPIVEAPTVTEEFTNELPTEEFKEETYDFSQPLGIESTPQPMTPLTPEPSSEVSLSEIADFGNADLGQAAFNYTVTISGIDSGAIRTQIEEAITDSKFGWNVIQVMAQIKGGVLTIKSMNAVKASILIQRVKYLPVKISWRQDVLSSTV